MRIENKWAILAFSFAVNVMDVFGIRIFLIFLLFFSGIFVHDIYREYKNMALSGHWSIRETYSEDIWRCVNDVRGTITFS